MPDKQSMKIKVMNRFSPELFVITDDRMSMSYWFQIGYDDTWHNSFGGDTSASTTYINSMITHMQAWMCLDSLGTKIDLEVSDFPLYDFFENI